TLAERMLPKDELVAAYRKRLEADPDNAQLQYLLGRVVDEDEALELFSRAASNATPCAHAFGALAWHDLSNGQFYDALDNTRQALKIDSGNSSFQSLRNESLIATGNFKDILKQNGEWMAKEEWSLQPVLSRIFLLVQSGSNASARFEIYRYGKKVEPLVAGKELADMRNSMEAAYAYAAGDIAALCKFGPLTEDYHFHAEITGGNIQKAEDLMNKMGVTNAFVDLQVYIAASLQPGSSNTALHHLQNAIEIFKNGGTEEKKLAGMLESGQALPESLLHLDMYPTEKRIALAALGLRIPSLKTEAFNLGRTLNYSPYPPALLLQKLWGAP
ncbi:MAG: hypothetical protein V2A34_01390, partial [Lentisphaerota bacterium]